MIMSDTYSGENTYIYSSRILNFKGISSVSKLLTSSNIFLMSLDSHNVLSYRNGGKLAQKSLDVQMALNEQGMKISNHMEFIESNTSQIYRYAFMIALNLFLSEKRLFNISYGFPLPKIRLFMHPVSITTETCDDSELYLPIVSIYDDGTIQLSFKSVTGFHYLSDKSIIRNIINKSQLNVTSFLCCKDLLLASIAHELSKETFPTKFINRFVFNQIMESSIKEPHQIEFCEEKLNLFELIQTNPITITDIARNLLSLLASSIVQGNTTLAFKWFQNSVQDKHIGYYWCAKPVIFIDKHSRQMNIASENWSTHKYFVDSVMSRAIQNSPNPEQLRKINDIRSLNDYNHFYSDAISLVLISKDASNNFTIQDSYTFENVISDALTLNEIGEYIKIYYCYAEQRIEQCRNTIEIVQEELSLITFESSLMSTQKYGEIAAFIQCVKCGDFVMNSIKNVERKLEGVRKSLELNEKISSEIDSKRITIFFGVLASASLSPEIVQPALQAMNLAPKESGTLKIIGFLISIVFVCLCLPLTKFIWKHNPKNKN